MNDTIITSEEWKTTLKVLQALSSDPFIAPEEHEKQLKGLITKIRKKAQKSLRAEARESEKVVVRRRVQTGFEGESQEVLKTKSQALLEETVIVDNALSIQSDYTPKKYSGEDFIGQVDKPQNCYCCNSSYQDIHFFYHKLCPICAVDNYQRRFETTNLENRFVLITGARVKVGYATALNFLRAGATIIATTRFPATALKQYQKEEDYHIWGERLTLYGLDLRYIETVKEFITFLYDEIPHLDIIINNAAQTIKYPNNYYTPFIQIEQEYALLAHKAKNMYLLDYQKIGLLEHSYPLDRLTPTLNRFSQPVDRRATNSWVEALDEVDTLEMIEANFINSISPAMLNGHLKKLMLASPYPYRFIINVTSSEGQFSYRGKTKYHPHTNMTKASLNMMTRTSAQDYESDNILMNSVDVGWVSTGNPEKKRKRMEDNGFVPPLDSVDSASRILHPILDSITHNKHHAGELFKDFVVASW